MHKNNSNNSKKKKKKEREISDNVGYETFLNHHNERNMLLVVKTMSFQKPAHRSLYNSMKYEKSSLKPRPKTPGGVLNFELGTDVRPQVSTTTL